MSTPDTPQQSDLRATLDERSAGRRRVGFIAGGIAAAGLLAAGVVFAASALGGNTAGAEGAAAPEDTPSEPLTVRIATSQDSDFQTAIAEVAREKGLIVEWVNLSDWVLPNTELAAGSVDANAFQHILYLSNFNVQNDEDLTPVFSTVITQWGIFSATLDSLDELEAGARIAIPDDPSNGGRALFILEAAGLLEIADDSGEFPTLDDVTSNPLNLELVAIQATTIPQQFDDPSLSAVVVGTAYFDPSQNITSEDALYLDNSLDEANLPYINVIATRDENKDDPAWEILREAYADPRVAEALQVESAGATTLVQVPTETLRSKLADLEELARANL